jgi:hypothetical protein
MFQLAAYSRRTPFIHTINCRAPFDPVQRRVAFRALRRKHVGFARPARSPTLVHSHHRRDDIAGFLQIHQVADPQIAPGDLGHSGIVIRATGADGAVIEEDFRAIVVSPSAYGFAVMPD